jgi:hypothetical protein
VLPRILLGLLLLAAVPGCGGGSASEPLDAADIVRANHAREAVHMQRVLGDDPLSESVSLRVDGTAAVRRGGGRGYWDVAIELSPGDRERMLDLARSAPFAALAANTITPGGFAGVRYMLRRGGASVTIAGTDLPPHMRSLVDELNALIDGDRGRIVADDRHFSASGTTGTARGGDDGADEEIDSTLATPVRGAGAAPRAESSYSCYGWGGRAERAAPRGAGAGPIVLSGLTRGSGPGVIEAPAVVQPGGAATVAIARADRDRAGLLYGFAWRGPHRLSDAEHAVRFEGCSDTTEGGGATRFDGALVVRGRGCVTLELWISSRASPVRRRVACR